MSYNWFTDYTSYLSQFMVVVCRLVQFCFPSVKGYFPANSSVHVCFIFQANNAEWSCATPSIRFKSCHVFISRTRELQFHAMSPKLTQKVYLEVRINILYCGNHMHPHVFGLQDKGDIFSLRLSPQNELK